MSTATQSEGRLHRYRKPALMLFAILLAIAFAAVYEPSTPSETSTPAGTSNSQQTIEPGYATDGASTFELDDLRGKDSPQSAGKAEQESGADIAAPESISTLAQPNIGVDSRIIRSGSITVEVPRKSFSDSVSEISKFASSLGGYVSASNQSGAGDGPLMATVTMRVPSQKFDRVVELVQNADGVTVDGIEISSQDVSEEFVDTESRLRHDRSVERRLMTLIAEAKDVGEVLAVQARLDQVQSQIEVAEGRLRYLKNLTSLATLEVSVRAPSKAGDNGDDKQADEWGFTQAFSDAAHRFTDNVNSAIVWLGGVLPALIGLVAVLFVAKIIVRRKNR